MAVKTSHVKLLPRDLRSRGKRICVRTGPSDTDLTVDEISNLVFRAYVLKDDFLFCEENTPCFEETRGVRFIDNTEF